MDSRQPQHPFTRPPERSLIHNPNHQQSAPQPSQPQSPFPGYAPPTSQPQLPVHVPFSADPYPTARRDPFLPSPTAQQQQQQQHQQHQQQHQQQQQHHVRRSSYGIHGGEGIPPAQGERERHGGWGNTGTICAHHASSHPHSQSGPPPPPPPPSMSSSHNPPGPSPYGYDASRRRSLGGASPPIPYGAPSHDPPPPPPSFSRSHMPPPSSPQQQHSHALQAQRTPFTSTFGGGRELPGLGSQHRPGSSMSMSISSLIGGGDTGAPNQMSQSQSHSSPNNPPTNGPPPNNHSMQPPSPRRGLPSGSRSEFQPFRRQPSPERHMYTGGTPRVSEGHGFAAGSPTRPYPNQESPDQGRQSQSVQPYKPMVFQGARAYVPSPNDAHGRDSRQSNLNIPPRPNSQPAGPHGPHAPPDQETKTVYDTPGGRRNVYGQPEERRRTLGESHHTRPTAAEILGGPPQSLTDRERPVTVHPVSYSLFNPPRDQRSAPGPNPPPRSLWRQSVPEDAPRETTEARREDPSALYRGHPGYSATQQGPMSYANHSAEDMVRGRSLDHLGHRVVEQYHVPPTSDPHSTGKQKAEQLSRSLSSGGGAYPSRSMYDQPRRMGEEMQHSKSLLGLGSEAYRRGRASPLPQAVQGASGQPLSIGKDPSIKSEFGRMFSGLGSGLGTSTPSRGSPMPQSGHENLPPGTDLNDLSRLPRVNSQNSRKSKRVKDEEGAYDNEGVDGRGTPAGGRGAKRNKPSHHHHHAHAHHHHHHHHKADEEMAYAPSVSSTPFNGRYSNLPQNGGPAQPSHHHHHYHAAPHHHHHGPRGSQSAPVPSPKITPKMHDIQAVLDEAAKHPRKHLGSHLYEAMTDLPKPNSSLDDQFGYSSKPKALPRFERNPINCTFTIRVPRFHLKPRQRQQIVLQRHLWGARIYRDDSDPIAAAIHSGWIRGEWDETVDVNMLDPQITAPNDPSDAEDTLVKAPAAPVTPPADMDLQIDILILPRILDYKATVEYGISSRKSSRHDGLSFMIHQMRWVEDGYGSRGQERTAAALRRRLDASATLLSLQHGGDKSMRPFSGAAKVLA
ncbi:Rxt3-domain-containing protein [Pleomassaria siparia CBS 279.74]|uniref:Rxt3-domain-containing protein n=1 Tax=Pleomassaria siparia CBS 279.74 TaxID=1314801 RepID=A0A6G1K680_9PLEO|nr:Rxt3-domain-containing protein [Pleomassaria siparia CBS 279.74]